MSETHRLNKHWELIHYDYVLERGFRRRGYGMPYTNSIVKRHVKGLFMILGMKKPCMKCPLTILGEMLFCGPIPTGCVVCRDFVGIGEYKSGKVCPCHVLGKEEAVKRTWLALEEGGWLDD